MPKKISIKKLIIFILTLMLGGFLFVFSEYDDSPGGQLLGLLIAIGGFVNLVYKRKRFRNN